MMKQVRKRKSIAMVFDIERLKKKLLDKIEVNEETGCHLWTGATNYDGYGQVMHEGRAWATHRIAYELHNGPIPQDANKWWVLHKCDVPNCCNPEHLYVGSPSDNARDCANRARKRIGFRVFSSRNPDFDQNKKVGTVFYEYKGQIKTLKEWAEQFGVNYITLDQRFQAGWPEEDIQRSSRITRRHTAEDCNNFYRRFSGELEVKEYLQSKNKSSFRSIGMYQKLAMIDEVNFSLERAEAVIMSLHCNFDSNRGSAMQDTHVISCLAVILNEIDKAREAFEKGMSFEGDTSAAATAKASNLSETV